jgi:hypothetical protein
MEKTIQVELLSASEKKTAGEVRAKYYDKSERSKRALKILGLLWGIAFLYHHPSRTFYFGPGFFSRRPDCRFFLL